MRTADAPEAGAIALEPMLTTAELCALLGVPVSTVYDWRVHGKGPVAHRFGKHLRFAVADVRDWIAAQRETAPAGIGTPATGTVRDRADRSADGLEGGGRL